jgi:phosphoglycolate phosphatase-like HAD superfamily hydrolase
MPEKIRLKDYFKEENIITRDVVYPVKPSPRGLDMLKERLKLKDYQLMHVGDGQDDYLASKGANVFFTLMTQGLVKDVETISSMKKDRDYGGDYVKKGRKKLPKLLVCFDYGELEWWFSDAGGFDKAVKAVSFDLGDTLIMGGREEAYKLTDKDWPTWAVDKLLEERKVEKEIKERILKLKVESRWKRFGEFPGMNTTESRIAACFLMIAFDSKEKDLVSALYTEADKKLLSSAHKIADKSKISLNTSNVPEGLMVKDLARMFPSEQYNLFVGAGLKKALKKEKKTSHKDINTVLLSSNEWVKEYRKKEEDAYKKHCKVPHGLREFLELLKSQKKELCIYSSKSGVIVDAVLSFEKEIERM